MRYLLIRISQDIFSRYLKDISRISQRYLPRRYPQISFDIFIHIFLCIFLLIYVYLFAYPEISFFLSALYPWYIFLFIFQHPYHILRYLSTYPEISCHISCWIFAPVSAGPAGRGVPPLHCYTQATVFCICASGSGLIQALRPRRRAGRGPAAAGPHGRMGPVGRTAGPVEARRQGGRGQATERDDCWANSGDDSGPIVVSRRRSGSRGCHWHRGGPCSGGGGGGGGVGCFGGR